MCHHHHFKLASLWIVLGLAAQPAISADDLSLQQTVGDASSPSAGQEAAASAGGKTGLPMATHAAQMPKVVMARVGEAEITVEDFMRYLTTNPGKVRQATSWEGKAQLLRTAIENRLLIAAMIQEGLIEGDIKPEKLAPAMAELAQRHFPLPPAPPEDQLNAFYEANVEDFGIPAAVRLSQILINVPAGAGQEEKEAARARAQQALERLKAGEDFGQVAVEVSDRSDLRGRRGDIGFVTPRGHAWLGQAITGLEVGQFTEVIESPSGFDILLLTDRREAVLTPFAQVRDVVAKRMQEEAQAQARAEYVKQLAATIPVSIELDELKPYFAQGIIP